MPTSECVCVRLDLFYASSSRKCCIYLLLEPAFSPYTLKKATWRCSSSIMFVQFLRVSIKALRIDFVWNRVYKNQYTIEIVVLLRALFFPPMIHRPFTIIFPSLLIPICISPLIAFSPLSVARRNYNNRSIKKDMPRLAFRLCTSKPCLCFYYRRQLKGLRPRPIKTHTLEKTRQDLKKKKNW